MYLEQLINILNEIEVFSEETFNKKKAMYVYYFTYNYIIIKINILFFLTKDWIIKNLKKKFLLILNSLTNNNNNNNDDDEI